MDDQQTCGQGVAEHSALPAQLAEVTEAMADNLQVHMAALELDDEPARQEHAVYLRLVEEQRQAAGRLRAVAREMAAARDLPMGRHDAETMRSPEVGDAFRGVRVLAGDHRVVFTYQDRALQAGLALSTLTAAALVTLWLWRRRQDRPFRIVSSAP